MIYNIGKCIIKN